MRLTQYSNFTLRTLQLVALRAPAIVTVDDVARAHRISKAHLVKVAAELARRGYIDSLRGRHGGMRLARPADSITVGEIIRWTEAPLELVECFNPDTNTCPLLGACHLSRGLQRALRAFLSVLDDLTIADIAYNKNALLARLGGVSPAEAHDQAAALPQDADAP
ncbi:RrF2 family transcriptional regulator [Falsiroseomonas selenitidurans]|uniref:Rrf2 family transcriptional regulator n=1 Tax=Falsiroseomonas selenitidurans TaxID=2716335 RepID=A0ABX1E1I6_9PROT|nr:Rrf2 family transcriptional regulator [Falsiroseomonas selenitidurans]NKC29392.1 Rrf2 family transcriptional regulator [Falsiroseomonas selenitidurans]